MKQEASPPGEPDDILLALVRRQLPGCDDARAFELVAELASLNSALRGRLPRLNFTSEPSQFAVLLEEYSR